MITGAQIKDGTVTTNDVKDKTLKLADISQAARTSLHGAKGATGAPGLVRAYARVSGASVSMQSGGITSAVPTAGLTCVTVPGLSSLTQAYVVSLDYSTDSTSTSTQAYAETGPGLCAAPAFAVRTFQRDAGTGVRTDTDEPFMILIP
jgi:hypothetical protein